MIKKSKHFLIRRIYNTTIYSFRGLRQTFINEEAFRFEVLISIILIPTAFFLGDDVIEKVLLISTILMVFIVEILNSAIETVIDRISMDDNKLSGVAKDQGSAAVFVALILLVFVWGAILLN